MNESEIQPRQSVKILSVLALISLVALIYYPGLSGSFIFDDTSNIVENPGIHMESPSAGALAEAATAYGNRLPHRPIATISLAFDHWLWDGDPFGFKLTNLVLHLLTTVLVLLLASRLFQLAGEQSSFRAPYWAAFAVAAIWAVHPLQVSTVLYVVQRMEMLAALFIILSLLAFMAGRARLVSGVAGGWPLIAVAGFSAFLALLSKETGVLAPLFMLALELLVFRFATSSDRSARILKVGFGALVAVFLAVYLFWLVPEYVLGDRFVRREFTWFERLLTQLRVLPMYIGWILFPATEQYLFYYDHFRHSKGLLQPATTLLGGLFLLMLVVVAWLLRGRAPLVALGIVWFFIAHALTSNLFSLELVFEHRNYFAVLSVLLAVFATFSGLGAMKHGGKSVFVIVATLVLGLSVLTTIRSATWGDPMNLALHHVDVNPHSERAGLDMAELYLGNQSWDPTGSPFVSAAHKQLERVAKLPTARTTADQALIVLAAQREQPSPDDAWKRLLEKVRSRALNAADYDAIYNLVQQRYQRMAISDRRLWELHAQLCQRDDIPPQIHARFGYYAALILEDRRRSTSAFKRALQLLSGDRGGEQALRLALEESDIRLMGGVGACEKTEGGISAEWPARH